MLKVKHKQPVNTPDSAPN